MRIKSFKAEPKQDLCPQISQIYTDFLSAKTREKNAKPEHGNRRTWEPQNMGTAEHGNRRTWEPQNR